MSILAARDGKIIVRKEKYFRSTLNILIITLVMGSCNSVTKSNEFYIGSSNQTIPIGTYLNKNVSLIAVGEKDSLIIGEVSKLLKLEDGWFILDQNKTKGIYKIDRNGNIEAHYMRFGEGPNEYIDIYDFDVNVENNEINLLCYPNKILVMDYAFNLKHVYPLAEPYENIACFQNKVYLYGKNRTVFCLNPDTKQEIKIVSEGPMEQVSGYTNPVFHKVGDKLLFIARGSDRLYSILDGKATPIITLDYENKEEICKEMKEKGVQLSAFSMRPPRVYSFFETSRKTLCMIYSNPIFRICEFSLKNNTVLKDGQYISTIPSFMSCQSGKNKLIGTAMGLYGPLIEGIKKSGLVIESKNLPIKNDNEEQLFIMTYDIN